MWIALKKRHKLSGVCGEENSPYYCRHYLDQKAVFPFAGECRLAIGQYFPHIGGQTGVLLLCEVRGPQIIGVRAELCALQPRHSIRECALEQKTLGLFQNLGRGVGTMVGARKDANKPNQPTLLNCELGVDQTRLVALLLAPERQRVLNLEFSATIPDKMC